MRYASVDFFFVLAPCILPYASVCLTLIRHATWPSIRRMSEVKSIEAGHSSI
jgi:hypothetical protein